RKIEDLLNELNGGKPDAFECKYLAVVWTALKNETGYKRAIELQKQAIELCPKDDPRMVIEFYADLAPTYVFNKDYPNAAEALKVIAPRDDTPDAQRFNVGNDLPYLPPPELNTPKEALPYAQQARQLQPDTPTGLDTRAPITMKQADKADERGDRAAATAK